MINHNNSFFPFQKDAKINPTIEIPISFLWEVSNACDLALSAGFTARRGDIINVFLVYCEIAMGLHINGFIPKGTREIIIPSSKFPVSYISREAGISNQKVTKARKFLLASGVLAIQIKPHATILKTRWEDLTFPEGANCNECGIDCGNDNKIPICDEKEGAWLEKLDLLE